MALVTKKEEIGDKKREDGQNENYLVLKEDEQSKFVRPLYNWYMHKLCGGITSIPPLIAKTYARQPDFYSGTYCYRCQQHYPLVDLDGNRAFTWENTGKGVGE